MEKVGNVSKCELEWESPSSVGSWWDGNPGEGLEEMEIQGKEPLSRAGAAGTPLALLSLGLPGFGAELGSGGATERLLGASRLD